MVVASRRVMLITCLVAAPAVGQDATKLPPEMAGRDSPKQGPAALAVDLNPSWKPQQETLAIPTTDTPQSLTLRMPARPIPKGKLLVMRLRTRMPTKGFGGWNNFLLLHVNGERLATYTKDGTPRILNRADRVVRTTDPSYPNEPYFKRIAGNPPALLTVFGPSWDALEPRFTSDRREMYWFLIDITDVAKRTGVNELRLTNTALAKYFNKTPEQLREMPLLVDSLEVGLVNEAVRDRLVENLDAGIAAYRPTAKLAAGGIELSASAGGAVRVRRNGEDYYLRSSFSEAGKRIRFNRFAWQPEGPWRVWAAVEGAASESPRLVVVGEAPSYRVRRELRLDGAFVRIADTISNTTDADVGVMLGHDLIAGVSGKAWRLAGIANSPTHDRPAPNPTLHFSGTRAGLGAAIKDSVMRAQMTLVGGRRKLSVVNNHFGLAAGASYAVQWQLYVGGPDFWEFINALRRDWDANHTIPGMFSFWRVEAEPHRSLMETPEKLRAYLERKPIDVFSATPWFEYYYKPLYWQPRSVYKASVQNTMRKLKAVQPGAKVIACIESFLYYVPESFFQGTLPAFWTDKKGDVARSAGAVHDYALSAAATKVVDATPWRDSVFRTADGRVEIDLYYATRYKDGGVNLKVYPTLDNYWHKRFLDMLDFLINDCELDGVYIDSFTYYHNRSYDRWDGHSVDIDTATGAVKRKFARLGLLTAPARREWVKYVTDRGKICYVNGKRSTAELQDTPQVGFMEAEWTFEPFADELRAPRAAQAQLSAPLALGVRPQRWTKEAPTRYAEIVQRAVIAYLRHGALYCHYTTEIPAPEEPGGGDYGILRHMYPFTPIELHEGWVVGKERILTAVSGTFHWSRAERPIALRFDIRGMPVDGGFEMTKRGGGWQVEARLNDWRETAVIKAAPSR